MIKYHLKNINCRRLWLDVVSVSRRVVFARPRRRPTGTTRNHKILILDYQDAKMESQGSKKGLPGFKKGRPGTQKGAPESKKRNTRVPKRSTVIVDLVEDLILHVEDLTLLVLRDGGQILR